MICCLFDAVININNIMIISRAKATITDSTSNLPPLLFMYTYSPSVTGGITHLHLHLIRRLKELTAINVLPTHVMNNGNEWICWSFSIKSNVPH